MSTTPVNNKMAIIMYVPSRFDSKIARLPSSKKANLRKNGSFHFRSCFAAFGGFLYGYDTGNISGVKEMAYFTRQMGDLQPDGTYALSSGDNSLITSILSAGTFVGALGAAPIGNKLGRRYGIMAYLVLFCIGVACQTGGTDLTTFVIGRVFAGLGVGGTSCLVPMCEFEALNFLSFCGIDDFLRFRPIRVRSSSHSRYDRRCLPMDDHYRSPHRRCRRQRYQGSKRSRILRNSYRVRLLFSSVYLSLLLTSLAFLQITICMGFHLGGRIGFPSRIPSLPHLSWKGCASSTISRPHSRCRHRLSSSR